MESLFYRALFFNPIFWNGVNMYFVVTLDRGMISRSDFEHELPAIFFNFGKMLLEKTALKSGPLYRNGCLIGQTEIVEVLADSEMENGTARMEIKLGWSEGDTQIAEVLFALHRALSHIEFGEKIFGISEFGVLIVNYQHKEEN
ncbi:hypothetical protein [Giesbergeria sp.]|uniref:hypothetical protein n=1 Tax=Giesbergeria sp. TaxID=2818473 RepID=UPI00261B3062|nr:hypothetical protein [Giesbergeria sp.]